MSLRVKIEKILNINHNVHDAYGVAGMDKVEAILHTIEEEIRKVRLVCSAEENGEPPNDGCDCARYNEAVDEMIYRVTTEKLKG